MAYFLVAPSGHAAELPHRPLCVGTDPAADIPILANVGLAPRHFVLVPQDRGFRLQSLTPEAVVKVNGTTVMNHELRVGDLIEAGLLAFRFQADPNAITEPPAPPPPPDVEPVEPPAGLTPPPLPPEFPPPLPAQQVEASEPAEPRRGFRRPESPRPLILDEDSSQAPSLPGVPNLDRAMAAAERAKAYIEEQKADQNMGGAIVIGAITAIAVSFVWSMVNFLPWLFFFAVVSGLGFVVGSAVRAAGKGFELRFGYAGALLALSAGLMANYWRASDFSADTAPEPKSGKVEIYGADEATNESFRASLTDLGIDPESPEFEADEEDEADGAISDPSSSEGPSKLLFALLMFGPRALISYAVAMGAAYKASFRTLTADEAARMQFG